MNELRIPSALDPSRTAAGGTARGELPGEGFLERMKQVLQETDRAQKEAEREVRDLANGSKRTTETMLALSRAELSMRFVLALRNRAVQAYQEIMRLQI